MQGSLSLVRGVLYVGRHELTAHVRPYDLDGRALGPGFSFRGPDGEAARVSGLAVDEDHHVWVADGAAGRVRAFNLFGRECGGFGAAGGDVRGALTGVSDLCLLPPVGEGSDGNFTLVTTRGQRLRHALQVFEPDGRWVQSLRPEGDPRGQFRGLRRVASDGKLIWACDARAGVVQVFRDLEFHFLFKVPVRAGGRFEPTAVAPLQDGRMILATGGADSSLLLLDAGGRLLRVLAEAGHAAGEVFEPEDIALEEDSGDRSRRLAVIDRDAERVQVFTVEGRCHGALEEMPGEAQ